MEKEFNNAILALGEWLDGQGGEYFIVAHEGNNKPIVTYHDKERAALLLGKMMAQDKELHNLITWANLATLMYKLKGVVSEEAYEDMLVKWRNILKKGDEDGEDI
jgi:hypothetical protein